MIRVDDADCRSRLFTGRLPAQIFDRRREVGNHVIERTKLGAAVAKARIDDAIGRIDRKDVFVSDKGLEPSGGQAAQGSVIEIRLVAAIVVFLGGILIWVLISKFANSRKKEKD